MKTAYLGLLLAVMMVAGQKRASACHAIALINYNQIQVVPGGIQITAASDSPTCGCGAYWLDVEFRCIGDSLDDSGLNAGNWNPAIEAPYFQSMQMFKPSCVVQNYPWVTIDDTLLCPGVTYQYRLRENHNGQVGPWTPLQYYTAPGTITPGQLTLTANPNPTCGSTQLGWTLTPGSGGCGSNNDTTFLWESLAGDPIIVGVNFSCDTCPYPIATPSQTTTYQLTIGVGDSACGGWLAQDQITVSVLPWPVPGVVTATADCSSGNITVDMTGYSGNVQWQSAPGPGGPWTNIPGANMVPYIDTNPGSSTCYRAEITDACGTAYSNEVCTNMGSPATASFSFGAGCNGSAVSFTDQSTSTVGTITGWEWDFGDGSPLDNSQSPNHTYTGTGPYNVTLVVTNSGGCTDTVTMPVQLSVSPVADFGMTNLCEGELASFTDQSTIASGSIVGWEWIFGNGQTSNNQNPSVTYNNQNTYAVQLVVTSDMGCTDTSKQLLSVFPQPNAAFSSTFVCGDGSPNDFTNQSSIATGSIDSYSWDFGDGNSSSAQDPSHTYANSGSYTVTLIASTLNGCADTVTQVTHVYANPAADFIADELEGCSKLCPEFTDQSTISSGSIVAWEWNFGNGDNSYNQNPSLCYSHLLPYGTSSFDVTLIVTSDNGCTDTLVMQNYINVHSTPVAAFTPNPSVTNLYNAYIDFINSSTGADTYAWDFGDGGMSTDINPSHHYLDTGIYMVELIAANQYGCADTTEMPVEITPVPSCYAATAFTPDGDGVNDVFQPVLAGYDNLQYELFIFDRGGEIIFRTTDPNEGWTGAVKGKPADAKTDVFVWKIIASGSNPGADRKEYVGHVTVLR